MNDLPGRQLRLPINNGPRRKPRKVSNAVPSTEHAGHDRFARGGCDQNADAGLDRPASWTLVIAAFSCLAV
jgi:hypothetical protein